MACAAPARKSRIVISTGNFPPLPLVLYVCLDALIYSMSAVDCLAIAQTEYCVNNSFRDTEMSH